MLYIIWQFISQIVEGQQRPLQSSVGKELFFLCVIHSKKKAKKKKKKEEEEGLYPERTNKDQ